MERMYLAETIGCLLRVSESPQAQLQGRHGIVVKESRSAFHLIDSEDRLFIAPKKDGVFQFALAGRKQLVTLLGNGLTHRSGGGTPVN